MKNLGKDLADSRAFMYVLHVLDPVQCPLDSLDEVDDLKRAESMFINSLTFGAADVVGPADILRGNAQVNLALVSEIFDAWHRKNFSKRLTAPLEVVYLDEEEETKGPGGKPKVNYEASGSSDSSVGNEVEETKLKMLI